jgi:catechol 2,3-dioxygenase-like lactoylglutathione lyase family enzyme
MKVQTLNHIALHVSDADKSAEFYNRYCGMETIHSREDNDIHVRWVRHPDQKDGFMIVLLETLGALSTEPGNMDHLGFYVESRKDVDEIAEKAKKEGVLVEDPQYAGPIVGYFCMIRDPDGYLVEFSCEQLQV